MTDIEESLARGLADSAAGRVVDLGSFTPYTIEDTAVYDRVSANTLEPGDQIIIDGDRVRLITVDSDREDIDEVFVTFENFDGEAEDAPLYADDEFDLWAL